MTLTYTVFNTIITRESLSEYTFHGIIVAIQNSKLIEVKLYGNYDANNTLKRKFNLKFYYLTNKD